MTNPNKAHIAVVLDRSGSMAAIQEDVVGGFNTFIQEQKKGPGVCTVSLVQFDDKYEINYVDLPLDEVPKLTVGDNYVPRGTTALNDAVGKTVVMLGEKFKAMPEHERPGKVILVIITDGLENASKEYDGDRVYNMLQTQQNEFSWVVTYLAADMNKAHVATAKSLGIRGSMVLQSSRTSKGAGALYAASSASVLRARAGGDAGYTIGERAQAAKAAMDDDSDASA